MPTRSHALQDTLWRNRPYLFLISAQAVSNLGDWLYILALLILVGVHWHGSPALIAATMLCLSAPMVLLGPVTGVLADRLNRTALMMVSNLMMAVLIGAIPFITQHWQLFAILILAGSVEALFAPAEQGKLKDIVPDSQMDRAVPVNSAISQVAKIAGPGLSGVLVATLGPNAAFYLDAASFVLSTVLLVFTGFGANTPQAQTDDALPGCSERDDPQDAGEFAMDEESRASFEQRFRVGWRYIVSQRMLWMGTIVLVAIVLVLQLADSQFITLLRLLPRLSPNLFGDVMAASGVGALLAALLTGRFRWKSTILVIGIGSLGGGLAFGSEALIVAAHWNQWITTVPAFFAGGCASLAFLPFQTMAQRLTPAHLTGRVFGVIGSMTTGAALMGPVAGGVVITAFGPIAGFFVSGIGLAAIGLTTLIMKRWMEGGALDVTEGDGGVQETTAT